MKKLIVIILFAFCANLTAQTKNTDWFSDYKDAIKSSESLSLPMLVFIIDNSEDKSYKLLQEEVFNSEDFKTIASNVVLLRLDTSANPYHKRLAKHYSKRDVVPALALVDESGNTIGKALTDINAKTISDFLKFLNSKTTR